MIHRHVCRQSEMRGGEDNNVALGGCGPGGRHNSPGHFLLIMNRSVQEERNEDIEIKVIERTFPLKKLND